MKLKPYKPKPYIEIMSGSLWAQQQKWRQVASVLPANACLLVTHGNDPRHTQVMRQIAREFRDGGRQVLIWLMPPNEAKANS